MESKMAKRQRKAKTEAEMAAIEADRIAAAAGTGPYAEPTEEDHEIAREIFKEMNAPTPEDVAAYEDQQDEEAEMTEEELLEATALGESEEADEERVPNSIVKDKFKVKYIENATALGLTSKAAKRSNWDWLSQMLAAFCMNDKGKIDIGSFTDVLDANGVDHSKWTNRNKGWEGRFRMTGRVALQKVVANSGVLKWPGDLEATPAPAEWAERFKTKA